MRSVQCIGCAKQMSFDLFESNDMPAACTESAIPRTSGCESAEHVAERIEAFASACG